MFRSVCVALLLSAAVISALPAEVEVEPVQRLADNEDYQNVVNYLNENASGNDLYDIIECFSDAMDDMSAADEARSLSSVAQEIFHEIPWTKVLQYVEGKLANDPKFTKIYAMLKDSKFQDLLNKAVSSKALRNYISSVESNGFTWSGFVTFALKAICDTAIVSHHDTYSEGVCKALRNL